MAAASIISNQATQGSDYGPRYIEDSSPTQSFAIRETDKGYALRTYLQDKQAHERLALSFRTATANESPRKHTQEMEEKIRSLETKL